MNSHMEDLESKLAEYEQRYGKQSAPQPTTNLRNGQHDEVISLRSSPSTGTVVNIRNSPRSLPEPASAQMTPLTITCSGTTSNSYPGSRLEQSAPSSHQPTLGESNGTVVLGVRDSPVHPQAPKGSELMRPQLIQAATASIATDNEEGRKFDSEITFMDGMVEYAGSPLGDMQTGDVFDTSSTVNFALKIQASTMGKHERSVISLNNSLSSTTDTKAAAFTQGDNWMALKLYLNHTYLRYMPQRMIASCLLDRYFSTVNSVWPFLIEVTTRQRFNTLFSSDEAPNAIWMSQLNLVFALACQFYESETEAPLTDIYNVGKDFYLRGQGVVIAHASDTCNITMLQNLLLVLQYQQGTMRSNECWLTSGHATRMALSLGLHTPSAIRETLDPLEEELRKRLWWGCFSLDR